jgi:hypothetical protein
VAKKYVVKHGDSLWKLAGQQLGNPNRWPEVWSFHNQQVSRSRENGNRIFRIQDPNIIFVGQILYLPASYTHKSSSITETVPKIQACRAAIAIDLKIAYTFGHDEKPIIYIQEDSDYIIKAEMAGKITIEINSHDRYQHNLEMLMIKDVIQCKQKLNEIYNPAFTALTSKPEMVLKNNKVILTPVLSTETNIEPFTINVSTQTPNHLKGKYKPRPIAGDLVSNSRKYKYTVEIEFIVDVYKKPDNNKQKQEGFLSSLRKEFAAMGEGVYNTFSNKEFLNEIGRGFKQAGKVVALTHAAVAFKAYAIFDIATGGPVTTTTMVAAGTPTGQKIIIEFIPSMNPGTLPNLSTLYGVLGWVAGTMIENYTTHE